MSISEKRGRALTVASAIVGLILAALILAACGGGDSGDDYAARLRGDPTATPAPTAQAAQLAAPVPTVAVLATFPTSEPSPTMAPAPTLLPTTTPYVPPPTATPPTSVGVCHYEWIGELRVAIFCPEGVQP